MPQAACGTGRPRVASGGLEDGVHGYGHTDAGTVRQRARARVRRRVHNRILATWTCRMETVQEMGRQTGKLKLCMIEVRSRKTIVRYIFHKRFNNPSRRQFSNEIVSV